MSQAPGSKSDDHTPHLIFTTMTSSGGGLHGDINTGGGLGSILMDESVSMDEFKMSPATDALEYLLNAASHVATTAGTDTTTTSTLQQNDDQVFDLRRQGLGLTFYSIIWWTLKKSFSTKLIKIQLDLLV